MPAQLSGALADLAGVIVAPGSYSVRQALAHWRSVRGLGHSQQITVHHIGDSIGTGSVASDWKLGYAELVRAWMIATLGLPLAGDFVPPMYSPDFSGGAPSGTLPWVIAGGDAGLTSWGYQFLPANTVTNFARTTSADGHLTASSATYTSASAAFKQGDIGAAVSAPGAGAAGGTLTTTILSVQSPTSCTLAANAGTSVTTAAVTITPLFTCQFSSSAMPSPNCVNIDAHVLNRGGTCHLALDGVDQGLITNANDNTWTIVPFSSLTSTSHTVSMITQSGSEAGLLGGVSIYPGARNASGLLFARFAGAGIQAYGGWTNTASDRPANQFLNLTGGNYHAGSSGFPGAGCDLLLLELGINDMQNGATAANYMQALVNFCNAERMATPNCSIVFIVANSEDPTYGQVTGGNWTNAAQWRVGIAYKQIAYQVAQMFGAVIIDLDTDWMNNGVTLGYVAANQPHPTTNGHARIATLIEAALAA